MARHVTPSFILIRFVRFWIGCHYYYIFFCFCLSFVRVSRLLCWYVRSKQVYWYLSKTARRSRPLNVLLHFIVITVNCAHIRVHSIPYIYILNRVCVPLSLEIIPTLPLFFIGSITCFSTLRSCLFIRFATDNQRYQS